MLTPYRADVNRIVADYIRARGFEVPVFGSFNEQDDGVVARITPASVKRGVETILSHAAVDAVFVSCTSVRLAEAARAIEAETGVPITSSNHAMAWHALRLAGVNDVMPQWGRLFETQTGLMQEIHRETIAARAPLEPGDQQGRDAAHHRHPWPAGGRFPLLQCA